MSQNCSVDGSGYSPSSIVDAFHGIPHVDIDLERSSSEFEVSLDYFEAIIIWGSVPVLACVCLFILMSVYYICVCCCCKEKKIRPKAINCGCAFLISLLILFCLGLIGAGLYAEFSFNKNVMSTIDDGVKINDQLLDFSNDIKSLNSTEVEEALKYVIDNISDSQVSEDARSLQTAVNDVNDGLSSVLEPLDSAEFSSSINDADYYEEIRHWSIVGYLVFLAFILLIVLVVSFCMTSVGSIVMLIIVGVVTFTVWIICGSNLSLLIVMSDVCDNPDGVVRTLLNDSQGRVVVDYYIVCDDTCFPFEENFDNVTETLTNTDMLVTNIQEYIQNNQSNSELKARFQNVTTGIDTIRNVTTRVNGALQCVRSQGIHEYYRSSLNNGCENGFQFLLILFSLFVGLAVCFILLMCCLSCYAGLLVSSLKEDNDEEFVAYDAPRAATWSQRRSSYTEPYSNGHEFTNEEYRLTGLSRNATIEPPKYTDVGRPTSGEYDHFDT